MGDLASLPQSEIHIEFGSHRLYFLGHLASDAHTSLLVHNWKINRKIDCREVCQALWLVLQNKCTTPPITESWKKSANGIESIANFPHCIGAIDRKYIRLVCPAGSGSLLFNYEDYYSILLMAVADSLYRSNFVNIESYRKD